MRLWPVHSALQPAARPVRSLVPCFELCAPERLLTVALLTVGRAGVESAPLAQVIGQQQVIGDIEQ